MFSRSKITVVLLSQDLYVTLETYWESFRTTLTLEDTTTNSVVSVILSIDL